MCNEQRLFAKMQRGHKERVVAYSLLTAGGLCAVTFPSDLVAEQVSTVVAHAWGIFMIISGAMCLAGSITDRWLGEYAGIPLLASVLAFYGLSAVVAATNGDGEPTLLAYGLAVLPLPIFLLLRWRDVIEIKKAGVELGHMSKGE